MLCEILSASSRIWTRVSVSISYDDNHYTTGTFTICLRIKWVILLTICFDLIFKDMSLVSFLRCRLFWSHSVAKRLPQLILSEPKKCSASEGKNRSAESISDRGSDLRGKKRRFYSLFNSFVAKQAYFPEVHKIYDLKKYLHRQVDFSFSDLLPGKKIF